MLDLIPVIATVGVDESGQTYNINADDAATEIAQCLQAEKLIFLTDVPGLLEDVNNIDSLIAQVNTDQVREFISSGVISGGMIPKMAGCIRAIENGVGSVHLIDGRLPHVLLLELLTRAGVGTMVVSSQIENPQLPESTET
jgi:acetylglutamate kinase